jgi:hypothetical protein
MKFPQVLPARPMPQMPEITGHTPCFDTIRGIDNHFQPVKGLRPLYWWARELRRRGDILVDLRFDTATKTSTVTVRLANYQTVTVVRRHDNKAALPQDLPTLIAEGIWRLGALGWLPELRAVTEMLSQLGLIIAPAPVKPCTRPLPGWAVQPDPAVRVAYWWAVALKRHGWKLYACGREIAFSGFIAEIPNTAGGCDLMIYPGDMPDDGTEASALANHLARLGMSQRLTAHRVIGDAAAGEGRVI